MNIESVVVSVVMYSMSLYAALLFDDSFLAVLFWLFGILICIVGLINGEKN